MRLISRENAIMQDRQLLHLLLGETLAASIDGMNTQRHGGLLEPVTQRFGIDRKQFTTVHQSKNGHNQWLLSSQREDSQGIPEDIPGIFQGIRDTMTKEEQDLRKHWRRLLSLDDVWYGKSWRGSDGNVATRTMRAEEEQCVDEAR
jgi:hypothetical protein